MRESTAEERFYTVATGGFALVTILLAIAGLSGVVSQIATERVREIAIRLSLGATAADVVRPTVAQGMRPVAVGLALGLFGSWTTSRLLQGPLFEVTPLDPLAYAGAVLLLVASAAAACYIWPAGRHASSRWPC